MKIGKHASPEAALRRFRGRRCVLPPPSPEARHRRRSAGRKTRRGATLPAGFCRMRTRKKRPAYRSIFQNAALCGASSLPPPKSCVSPVMRSTAVPQPASKWAV